MYRASVGMATPGANVPLHTPIRPNNSLEERVRHNFLTELDTDGSGDISGLEVLAQYDTDRDGHLSTNELERLAAQLSEQTKLNNELLETVTQLEKSQLKSQVEAQNKQETLWKTLRAMEQVRAEAAEHKRQLLSMRNAHSNESKDARDAKFELERKQRELELMEAGKQKLLRDLEQTAQEHSKIVDQLRDAVTEKNRLNSVLEMVKRSSQEEIAELRKENNEWSSKLNMATTKLQHFEMKSATQAETLDKQQETLQQATLKVKRAEASLQVHQRQNMELEGMLKESQEGLKRLRKNVDEEKKRADKLDEQLANCKLDAKRHQDNHNQARAEAQQHATNHQTAVDMHENMAMENQRLKEALDAVNASRTKEQAAFQAQLQDNHAQLSSLADEARIRHREYAEQASRASEEARAHLADRDDQYVKLQNDYKHLHDILAKVQEENAEQAKTFQAEREDYEQRVHDAVQKAHAADQSSHDTIADAHGKIDRLEQNVNALQRELHIRAERYVETLGKMQDVFRKTKDQATAENLDLGAMRADVQELRNVINTNMHEMLKPTEEKNLKMRGHVQDMSDMMRRLKEDYETVRDDRYQAQAETEQMKGENIMLKEEVSKLEMAKHQLEMKLGDVQTESQAQMKALSVESQTATVMREDLQAQLKRTMEQLEYANNMSRKLQMDNRELQQKVHELTRSSSQQNQTLGKELHTARLEQQTMANENEKLNTERSQLLRDLQQQSAEVQRLQQELSRTEQTHRLSIHEERSTQGKYKAQVQSLGDSFRKLQTQLAHTKELLGTVQEQRKLLGHDNDNLRRELDAVYQKNMHAQDKSL